MNPTPIRILIVDDHFMVRVGIIGALSQETDMKVVGEARDGMTALQMFADLKPDVTLMDGILPDFHGIEVTRRIIADHPGARILLVSINDTGEDVYRAIEAGAAGYIPKSSEQTELLQAIRDVAAGFRYLPQDLARKLAIRRLTTPLSEREIEVLSLVAKGMGNKEIATSLGIAEGTIKTHLKHIISKLDARDRTSAVTLAQEQGILRF
ncbi:MAG: response regulator transcription factor [Armatimonadetes bacterium]|nr:response regulator transcription factor [Akkermansiaceae bacterium]